MKADSTSTAFERCRRLNGPCWPTDQIPIIRVTVEKHSVSPSPRPGTTVSFDAEALPETASSTSAPTRNLIAVWDAQTEAPGRAGSAGDNATL